MKINSKIYYVLGAVFLGVGGFFIYKRFSKSKNKDNDSSKNTNVDYGARGIKVIEKRLNDFNSLITDTFENNDKSKSNISEDMKKTLFSTFYRNLKSFKSGLSKDNLSEETKKYGMSLIDDFEKRYRKYLPFEKYNENLDWYVKAEQNIIKKWGSDTDFYNPKVI